MASFLSWVKANWQLSYLVYSAAACTAIVLAVAKFGRFKNGAQRAATAWGSICFALLLFYMLGAANGRPQFITFFGFGAAGTALGYLAGVWLAPSSMSEENRFAKAQNLMATLLAGALGTKLLSLWDDLTKGDNKLIYQSAFYLPLLCALVGFFVALAAFYTLRSAQAGQVKITAPASQFVHWTAGPKLSGENGIIAGHTVQFAGVAEFDDDLSVLWSLKPADPKAPAAVLPNGTISAAGLLTAPDQDWISKNPKALDWTVIATSNRDRSRCATYDVHFVEAEVG